MKRILLVAALVLLCAAPSWGFGFGFGFGTWFGGKARAQWVDLVQSLSWVSDDVRYVAQSLDFGSHDFGTTTTAKLEVVNSGTDTAEEVVISAVGAAFSLYSTTTFGNISSLPGTNTRPVKVKFTPPGAGVFTGFLRYSAPNIPRVGVALSGTGVGGAPTQYDDAFTGTDGTLLAAYNNKWASMGATYTVGGFKILGNVVTTISTFTSAGAYHTDSTSDVSQITIKALTNTAQTVNKNVAIRADGTGTGYGALLSLTAGNWANAYFKKNGAALGSACTGLAYAASADHTLRLVATGTAPVTLTLYVDSTQVCQTTDSSPLAAGHPGFYVSGNGTVGNNAFDDWRDY